MDADDRQALAPGRAQARVERADVAVRAGLVEHVEADDRAALAAPLDLLVHALEVRDGVADAIPGLLRLVVDLVPGAEVAYAQPAEVRHELLDVAAVARRGDDRAALLAQVGRRDVDQRLHAGRTGGGHEGGRLLELGGVAHDVGRHEVARALDLQLLEAGVGEHRRALVGEPDAYRAACRRRRGRHEHEEGEQREQDLWAHGVSNRAARGKVAGSMGVRGTSHEV